MPGELGNEEEQQSVGYYEHRYQPRIDDYPSPEQKKKPKLDMILNVIKLMGDQES